MYTNSFETWLVACADPEYLSGSGSGGGPENLLVINVSHRGSCGPPSRSNWTQGVQLPPEGVRTSFSKEPYNNM